MNNRYEAALAALPARRSVTTLEGATTLLQTLLTHASPEAVYEASACLADTHRTLRSELYGLWEGWVSCDEDEERAHLTEQDAQYIWKALKAMLAGTYRSRYIC